jgi:hypothetical protein
MILDFRQGIIVYPSSGPLAANQQFLTYSGGNVSLQSSAGRTDVTFAHGSEDYLYTESTTSINAWSAIPTNVDVWLYWDINLRTAARTFGYTTTLPTVGSTAPLTLIDGQHWFNTTTTKMMLYSAPYWREVVRVFAAKVNNGVFFPLGTANLSPFANTQVGLTAPGTTAGRIIVDDVGQPIRRANGLFFTSENDFFVQGSPANAIRLEANIFTGTALESIARYQVVKFSQFGQTNLATYNDTQNTAIAMSMQDVVQNQTGTLCMQGYITNPQWNWPTVGSLLWIHGTIAGTFTSIDPHISDPVTYNVGYPPVARVITPTSVFFDQGLGGKGEQGVQGLPGIAHANTIIIPQYHGLTGSTVNVQIQQLYDQQINVNGATMIGSLILSGTTPTNPLAAVPKSYVDNILGAPIPALGPPGTLLGVSSTGSVIYNTITGGTGMTVISGPTGITFNNTGVTSIIAGSGIAISGATGAVTITAAGVNSFNTRTGAVTLGYSDVVTALAFVPYDATNPAGYITTSYGSSNYVNLTTNQTIGGVKKFTATSETLVSPVISAGVLTLDLATANSFTVALNANISSFVFNNVAPSGTMQGFVLIFVADGTLRTASWPVTLKWPGGAAPTLTSTAGKQDVITVLTTDGGATWLAFIPAQNL